MPNNIRHNILSASKHTTKQIQQLFYSQSLSMSNIAYSMTSTFVYSIVYQRRKFNYASFFYYLPKVSKRTETNIKLDFLRTKQLLQRFYSLLESFKLCQFQPFFLFIFVTESRFRYIRCRQHPYTIYQSQLFNLSRLFRYTCSIASYDMLEYLKCIILQKDTMILLVNQ